MKRIKHVVFVIMLLVLTQPITVDAVYSNYVSNPTGHDSSCQSYLNISITADPYNRTTTMNTDDTSKRKITMNCKGRCKAYIYHANYGTLDNLESGIEISDEDEETPDDDIKLKKKTFTDSWEWSLPAGKEALVVVISVNRKVCDEKDKNGNCIKYKYPQKIAVKDYCPKVGDDGKCAVDTYHIKCPKGRFESTNNLTEAGDVNIKGNGAALFVQNPKESGLVPNLRHKDATYGEACKNAYMGIYDGEISQKQLYSITQKEGQTSEEYQSLLTEYRNDYYGKFLKYCDENSVAFNLKASKIKEMSNALLRTFYEAKRLEQGNYPSIEEIEEKIEVLELQTKSSNIFKNIEQLDRSLSCDSKTTTIQSESFLYKPEKTKISATLSNGQNVSVCETQCYEHLTVKYDPPAVTKAGLCFQYKVTVKSVSECGVNVDYSLNHITIPNMCSPSPICENNSGHTQAGPNEDFDSCIKECDNGKYTQKCINSCYDKVYKNNSKKTKKTSSKSRDIVISDSTPKISVLDNNKKYVIKRLSTAEYSSDELKGYYNENNNTTCTTEKIINYVHNGNSGKLDECAEYFFQAKALYPCGKYTNNGTVWDPDDYVTIAGATDSSTTNIPMQIARSSPFYLRSASETRSLLESLVVPVSKIGYWKKYNIDENGIKRQYSTRFICNQTCTYTGCNAGDVYTSAKFSNNIISDLQKIETAINQCKATAACDTEEKTTEFKIDIKAKRKSNDTTGESTGLTNLNSTIGIGDIDQDQDGNADMFVAEGRNEVGTGILGLCYNGMNTPHYQTTITYPGTYINYKTGKRIYTKETSPSYFFKKNYFCTPYDAENVNELYWNWAINDRYNSSLYPNNFNPKYNINAKLGNSGRRFGKYNWKINLNCFYALNNTVCLPGDPDCEYPTNQNECSSENSTQLCNASFRVVDSSVLFPDDEGNPIEEDANIPFNWTTAAQDKTPAVQAATARNYGIDPGEYRNRIQQAAQSNPSSVYGDGNTSNASYHIYLSKENIAQIKSHVKANGYTAYDGIHAPVEGITGLYAYRSNNILENPTFVKDFNRNTELGYNN